MAQASQEDEGRGGDAAPRVAGLLLAAGAGRRMGGPKGLLRTDTGLPWVARAAQALRDGGCDEVSVVVGAAGERVRALVPAWAHVVEAHDWAEGMGASLRAGLAALERSEAQAAVVMLVDTPGVEAVVVDRLVRRARLDGPAALARAAYHGRPGHPVVLGREHWAGAAAGAQGDEGARSYLRDRDVSGVECGDIGHGEDVDAPD